MIIRKTENSNKCELFSHKLSHVSPFNLLLGTSLFCNAQDPGSVFSRGKSQVYPAEGEQGPDQSSSGNLHLHWVGKSQAYAESHPYM